LILTGAVPVALPAMFTISVAFGSQELARRGVLGTRLSAAQDATTMDVLCVDKTGAVTGALASQDAQLVLGCPAE